MRTGNAIGLVVAACVFFSHSSTSGQTLYGTDLHAEYVLDIDPSTGEGSIIERFVEVDRITGLAYDPHTDTLYGCEKLNKQLLIIDQHTAAVTVVGNFGSPDTFLNVRGLAFDSNTNTLYGTNEKQLVTIDTATGAASFVGSFGFDKVVGLAFDPNSNTIYGCDAITDQLVSINPLTGEGIAIGPLGIAQCQGLAFDPHTDTLYGSVRIAPYPLIEIDTESGAGTVIGPMGFYSVEGLTFDPGELSEPNAAPVAVAGADQSIRAGDTVQLDGSQSYDDNTSSNALDYAWSFLFLPEGSTAVLENADTPFPSFVADITDTYVIELIVTDEEGASSAVDDLIVSGANLPPSAVASVDLDLVFVGETIQLSGIESVDPEGDELVFHWEILSAPDGSTAQIVSDGEGFAKLTIDVSGTYEIELIVEDFLGPGEPSYVTVEASEVAEYAELRLLIASDEVKELTRSQVTSLGNKAVLNLFIRLAARQVRRGNIEFAVWFIGQAIKRTDGCYMNQAVDGPGPSRDWIVDCEAQMVVYLDLLAALDALTY